MNLFPMINRETILFSSNFFNVMLYVRVFRGSNRVVYATLCDILRANDDGRTNANDICYPIY